MPLINSPLLRSPQSTSWEGKSVCIRKFSTSCDLLLLLLHSKTPLLLSPASCDAALHFAEVSTFQNFKNANIAFHFSLSSCSSSRMFRGRWKCTSVGLSDAYYLNLLKRVFNVLPLCAVFLLLLFLLLRLQSDVKYRVIF